MLNAMLPWTLMQAALPGRVERGYGRVANISSGSGSFTEGLDPGHAASAVSKTALNAVTVMAAGQASGDVKINAMCPGWVRTKMGGRPPAARPRRAPTPRCGWHRCPLMVRPVASFGIGDRFAGDAGGSGPMSRQRPICDLPAIGGDGDDTLVVIAAQLTELKVPRRDDHPC
ncbi:MAG: SDR family oxidoreductase [Alphaproteobacteria bacterium]